MRWQARLAFKRLKSLLGLGHLKKVDKGAQRRGCTANCFLQYCYRNFLFARAKFFPPGGMRPWEKRKSRWREAIYWSAIIGSVLIPYVGFTYSSVN
jgi:hypothetical protein